MTNAVTKPKWGLASSLIGLILLGNTLLYHTSLISPLPKEVVLGSLTDMLILIPLLFYLFVIRGRASIVYLPLVVLAGYGMAYLIIPSQYLAAYSFLPYVILAFEGFLIAFELFIVFRLIKNIPNIMKTFRSTSPDSYFYRNFQAAVYIHIQPNRLIDILISEFSLLYYAFFSWRKKAQITPGRHFTYHKKTSVIATYIMIIHATIFETVAFHFLIHQWLPIFAWILLVLNIYAVLFFFGEIRAICLSPIDLDDRVLYIQIGLMKRMKIPIDFIENFREYNGPEKLKKDERKEVFEATVIDIVNEKPTFEIILKEPLEVNYMYGMKRKVKRVLLNVDEKSEFEVCLKQKMT